MRRFDKNENIRKANLLAEQRYLASKGLITEDTNIDEISGELKRSAFDAALNKYNKTPDWDVANKSKYGDQGKLAMTHINPEVERDIKSLAQRFDLSVSFNKAVGDSDNVPYINLYFNKNGEVVDNNNYSFMINILPMKYNYSAGYRTPDAEQITPPQGFDRAIVKLIKDIQSKELSYSSSLNK
jgi:hypothetical protein